MPAGQLIEFLRLSGLEIRSAYDKRGRITSLGGASYVSTGYVPTYSYTVPTGGYSANGNLLAYSDQIMGNWAFQYDTLNRLTSAVPVANVPPMFQNLIGCYGYDAFGN